MVGELGVRTPITGSEDDPGVTLSKPLCLCLSVPQFPQLYNVNSTS